MNCVFCGKNATNVTERKAARYKDEVVEVLDEFFRCDSCKEEFVTPEQIRNHVRIVKNEVRRKHGLLPPERIVAIRNKLELTQEGLEELLGTGSKVVVRWESGKVIQGSGHDNTLRLLEREPHLLKQLKAISTERSREKEKYANSQNRHAVGAAVQGD